jgi:hypothetical protein
MSCMGETFEVLGESSRSNFKAILSYLHTFLGKTEYNHFNMK